MENVAGAFLVLIMGMTLASITAIIEFLWDSRRILTNENVRIISSIIPNNFSHLFSSPTNVDN